MNEYEYALQELLALLDDSSPDYKTLKVSLDILLMELKQDEYRLTSIQPGSDPRVSGTLDNDVQKAKQSCLQSVNRIDSLLNRLERSEKSIDDERIDSAVPSIFALYQNYPNPFNPTTQIQYDLPEDVRVQIIVYNTLGQLVTELRDDVQAAGRYTIFWDGKNANGLDVATGMYIYQIKAGNFVDAKKMLLLK